MAAPMPGAAAVPAPAPVPAPAAVPTSDGLDLLGVPKEPLPPPPPPPNQPPEGEGGEIFFQNEKGSVTQAQAESMMKREMQKRHCGKHQGKLLAGGYSIKDIV